MASGIYTALSGARVQDQRIDTLSNSMANAQTAGFKAQHNRWRQIFHQSTRGDPRQAMGIHHPARTLPVDRTPAQVHAQFTDWNQGPLHKTDNNLDLALEGEGFFLIQGPDGPLYTRDGRFSRSNEGTLINASGQAVLDTSGRPVSLGEGSDLFIAPDGSIEDEDTLLGQIGVKRFEDPDKLIRVGGNLWRAPEGLEPQESSASIQQGMVESPNLNLVAQMVDLIKANRTFEYNIRAIQTHNELDQQAARDVGRLS